MSTPRLVMVKVAHTIVWAFFASAILAIPVAAWYRRFGLSSTRSSCWGCCTASFGHSPEVVGHLQERRAIMASEFSVRVRAASKAAWWTFIAAAAFVTVQWLGYLLLMSVQPPWVLSAWGPASTWESVQSVWFTTLIVLKLTLWPLALVALWLTLWARQLQR
ncbi:MAG: hypothetical protein AB1806_14090 [Acidobacteriota bacterium]